MEHCFDHKEMVEMKQLVQEMHKALLGDMDHAGYISRIRLLEADVLELKDDKKTMQKAFNRVMVLIVVQLIGVLGYIVWQFIVHNVTF